MTLEDALKLLKAVEDAVGQRLKIHLVSTFGRDKREYHVEVRWGYLVGSDLKALAEIGEEFGLALEAMPSLDANDPTEITCARFYGYPGGEGGRA